MHRILKDCAVAYPGDGSASGFAATLASLEYQAEALGIEQRGQTDAGAAEVAYTFEAPGILPIRCEITAWPDSGIQLPAGENSMQAVCGLMSVHGRAAGRAQPLGVPYLSTLTSLLSLQGGMAAAIAQARGLDVRRSRVSMAAAGLLSVGQYLAGATAEELPEKLVPGAIEHPDCPPFMSRDGRVFELETLDADPWLRFWTAVGIDAQTSGKGWTAFLLRYAKAVAPLPQTMIARLADLPYAEIETLGRQAGVALCPLRTLAERAEASDCERVWRQGPWAFSSVEGAVSMLPGAAGILPLNGLTVVESCRRIQGPLAGHLLAMLGADVIRIEPPGGDPLRGMPPMANGCSARFDALNRHKTIREIDLKSAAGRQEVRDLARVADVFLHNWAPGKAAEFSLDARDLHAVNPALVYAYAGGWTAPDSTRHLLGTDFMTQAYTGVAAKIAAVSGRRGGSLFTVLDVLGGAVAAQGVTAALLQRCLHGCGAEVDSSLASAATLLTAADLAAIYRGESMPVAALPVDAAYATARGVLALDCPDAAAVRRVAEMLGVASEPGSAEFAAEMRRRMYLKPAADWARQLGQAGIAAAPAVEDLTELETNPLLQSCLRQGSYTQVTTPWSFA